jgi:hypothetical protein
MPAYARLLAPAGDGRTSFDHPFPGHPGVSQSRTPQAFHEYITKLQFLRERNWA